LIQSTDFFFSFSFVKYGRGKSLHAFPENKQGKARCNEHPPKRAAKDSSVLTEQLFGPEQLWLQVWFLCVEHKFQPCPDQWLRLPSKLGPFATLPRSSFTPVSLQRGQAYA